MVRRGAQCAEHPELSIKKYKDPSVLVEEIVSVDYSAWNTFLELRNKALVSLIAMTGLRISEILSLKTHQIDLDDDPDFLVIKDIVVLKKRKRIVLNDIGIRKNGVYQPLVEWFLEYLDEIKPGKIFSISRRHAWNIINELTGQWPHYYRSQKMSHLVNTLKGAGDATGKIMKVNPSTVSHYYKSSWRDHKEELQ